jgi:hypothetical protein
VYINFSRSTIWFFVCLAFCSVVSWGRAGADKGSRHGGQAVEVLHFTGKIYVIGTGAKYSGLGLDSRSS